ncbi:MAG: DUF2878 domain-containing protein [Planctomycetia bacterium]
MKRNIAAAVLFQGVWFSAVLGGAAGLAWPGMASAALFLALGWAWPRFLPWMSARDFLLWPLLGFTLDALPVALGWMRYEGSEGLPSWMAPLWIAALWWSFVPLFPGPLAWMRDRRLIAVLFGVIGAPLSYLGGERLGALHMDQRVWALLWIALVWGVLTPVLARKLAPARR